MDATTTLPALIDQTPAQIDEQLAELSYQRFVLTTRQAQYLKAAKDYRSGKHNFNRRPDIDSALKMEAHADALYPQIVEFDNQIAPLNAEFERRGGWTRAFLVQGGHVHRSMACSTCRPTTEFHWLTEYSDHNEDEIVADAGCIACTVCYPSAPVESLALPTKIFASEEDRIKAEKAAAAPADCAGSGTWDYPAETARKGYCAGNYGVCSHCGEAISISSTGKMRKHKVKKS